MKKFFFVILVMSPALIGNGVVPEKLLMASKAFSEDPTLYPIHRIDLIIFSHKTIQERDKEERFPKLDDLIYSNDLIKLSKSPSLLVNDQAITEGLVLNSIVIKSIKIISKEKENLGTEENKDKESTVDNSFLPYQYFVLLGEGDTQTQKLATKLDVKKEYEVLFHGSWYQPLFKKEFAL